MRSIHHSFGVQTSEWMNLVQSLPMLFIQVACSGFWNPADVALERHTNTVSTQHGECATNSTRRHLPVTSCYCHVGNNTDEQSALTHCHRYPIYILDQCVPILYNNASLSSWTQNRLLTCNSEEHIQSTWVHVCAWWISILFPPLKVRNEQQNYAHSVRPSVHLWFIFRWFSSL